MFNNLLFQASRFDRTGVQLARNGTMPVLLWISGLKIFKLRDR